MDILGKIIEGKEVTFDKKCVPLLWLSGQEIDARMNRISAKFGITSLQTIILYYLDESENGSMTINELSDCITQKANTSRSVTQLVKMGLVTKSRSDSDERVVFVNITEKGKMLKSSTAEALSILYSVGLNEEEAKVLYDLLIKVLTFQSVQEA